MGTSSRLLETRLEHGIELRKSGGDAVCNGAPSTLLQRGDGESLFASSERAAGVRLLFGSVVIDPLEKAITNKPPNTKFRLLPGVQELGPRISEHVGLNTAD
jgi:hypothetical protein